MCIGHTQVLKYTTEKLRDPTGKTVHATGSIVAGERTRPTQDMFNATSDRWRWIDYWDSLRLVVPFKRGVYEKALHELAPLAAGFADLAATAPPPRLDS